MGLNSIVNNLSYLEEDVKTFEKGLKSIKKVEHMIPNLHLNEEDKFFLRNYLDKESSRLHRSFRKRIEVEDASTSDWCYYCRPSRDRHHRNSTCNVADENERLVLKGALDNAVTQLVQSHIKMNRMILCTYSQAILMSRMILCTYSQAILVNYTRWLAVLLMQP
ncbi:hypothetical protein MKW98_015469 [Papaver atlanticum]|uniref:Uncharacterized protein n=1 Tax=Papaver atlanticum TaxID=357466 RepID=A0AAD4RZI2_9MAGN|nr:hypothetical protein MKW98_015469 [Papaver atlanticum]